MRVLVAPNAFKGSLSCADAARAMARGVRGALKGARVDAIPIADGGDGLIDALRAAFGGEVVLAPAHGPLGDKRRAAYLWVPSKRLAVIEMARASGLALVPAARRRPLAATTRGTGDLMRDAVRRGARTVVVGMGGSASSDGGAGMARALGARLLDCEGRELPDGAADLERLCSVDAKAVRSLLAGVTVVALSDVVNPLLGPRGSARIFGPQKGATAAQVRTLERCLAVWARALHRDLGVSVAAKPGAGAAGGLGAGLLAFADAEIVPGADWVIEKTGAARALKAADLVVTGEGRLDRTSLFGKAPVALARRAKRCVAVAGSVQKGFRGPFRRVVSFADAGAASEADSMRRAATWARKAAAAAVTGLAALALCVPARANKLASPETFDEAYFHRNVGTNLDDNIKALEGVLDAAVIGEGGETTKADAPWKAPYLWRLCRARMRKGETLKKKSEKLDMYQSAKEACEKSVALDPKATEAHFFLGVSLGRWAETKGMMKALFALKTIKKEMAEVLRLDPSHGGAHHVLAEIYWQVPGFAGGDKKKALEEFELAVKLSPTHSANYLPLAETYAHLGRREDALKVLDALESLKDPADPAELPDNLADAKALRQKLTAK